MRVTRHFSPENGKIPPKLGLVESNEWVQLLPFCPGANHKQTVGFCDWVSMYQRHDGGGLPLVNDGAFVRYNADGAHECTTLKKLKLEGSNETGVFVRCDGETVWFEGNVSRFGRPDNVFGFTFAECVQRINALLIGHGLPPFTPGKKMWVKCADGDRPNYTGARITRLDMTENFFAGSSENAYAFMRYLQMQQASRLKTGTYGEGETVDFGRGSRRVYSKAYLKHVELLRHMKKAKKNQTDYSTPFDPYIQNLSDWCKENGLVRFETTYKSTYLIDNHQNYLGGIDMSILEIDFQKRQEVFTRASCELDDLSSLDKASLSIYRMWQAGDDLPSMLSKTRFYVHRAKLLPYGIDIAIKSNVINFQPKTRVIKLAPATMPTFYELPKPTLIRLAA